MQERSETTSAHDPAPDAESGSTATSSITEPSPVFDDEILDEEISLIRYPLDAKNITAIGHLNGGSEEFQASMPDFLGVVPALPPSPENFVTLVKWKGRVVEINGDSFKAVLSPVIGDKSEKEAEIYVEDISAEDRHLIRNGAAFYWSVGYLDRPSGRVRASLLRFTRIPVWSSREIARAKNRAKTYSDLLSEE